MEIELRSRGLPFVREVQVAIPYKGETIENAFRADFIVGDRQGIRRMVNSIPGTLEKYSPDLRVIS